MGRCFGKILKAKRSVIQRSQWKEVKREPESPRFMVLSPNCLRDAFAAFSAFAIPVAPPASAKFAESAAKRGMKKGRNPPTVCDTGKTRGTMTLRSPPTFLTAARAPCKADFITTQELCPDDIDVFAALIILASSVVLCLFLRFIFSITYPLQTCFSVSWR